MFITNLYPTPLIFIIFKLESASSFLRSSEIKTKGNIAYIIQILSDHNVQMYVCGQSVAYSGISKIDILPEIKLAMSAMSVLTVYQSQGYSLIKF